MTGEAHRNAWGALARILGERRGGIGPDLSSGLCAQPDVDPDWWFPASSDCDDSVAERLCKGCPVIDECLRDALATESPTNCHGVRGGLTEHRRRAILRRRNTTPRPPRRRRLPGQELD